MTSTRREFIRTSALATAGTVLYGGQAIARAVYESNRPAAADRHFVSEAVENAIKTVKSGVPNKELAWLFENCFPNTLDTTVYFEEKNGRPDTYVITGDIDAMWLRDSSAQVWPYLSLIKNDARLQKLVAGVINRQTYCIHLDRYANAFFKDGTKESEWKKTDRTEMKPGIHERKWEIDSLCYPVRLAYRYWKITNDTSPFDSRWKEAIALIVRTFKEQQRKDGNKGPYQFERETSWATDGVPISGYGYPTKPVGLINSIFRPSDDVTLFPFLIPSNFFAVISLRQAAEMVSGISGDNTLAAECSRLADEVSAALARYAVTTHEQFGKVYAFEVNGYGSFHLMDDANVPSLLSLPYLDAVAAGDPVYRNTRRLVLSAYNPFFFKGRAGEGIGSPHTGTDTIWPISITIQALTSHSDEEIRKCLKQLTATHGGTGFMHESFHKDDPGQFTRKWFAWANTLFGELVWDLFNRKPQLIKGEL
ncbi:MAG: metal-independent alpha-mannosidase [Cytophagaceae bacterium SCN 52-12]|nr:MAG: metal-independent alpha-mannosidase [Cytophagaceae bacterium SCN 52-12]